jgi:hypothetical protein
MLDEFLGGYKIGSAFGVPGRKKGAKAIPLKVWKGDATLVHGCRAMPHLPAV